MYSLAIWILLTLYVSAAIGLFFYGINCYVMLYLFYRRKSKHLIEEKEYLDHFYKQKRSTELPMVTTQIPIYNEYNVVIRVIRALADMESGNDGRGAVRRNCASGGIAGV